MKKEQNIENSTKQALTIPFVRQRIKIVDRLKMDEDLFNKLADEYAEYLYKNIDISNINYLWVGGKYWQLKYVA